MTDACYCDNWYSRCKICFDVSAGKLPWKYIGCWMVFKLVYASLSEKVYYCWI